MFKFIFALFVIVPLLELYVLIEVGSGIGGLATIALCLLTAALGGILIRWQGLQTLLHAQREMMQGGLPTEHVAHAVLLAVAGLLLFLPGFITDTLGFLLLIPALRQWVIIWGINRRHQHQASNDANIIDAEIIETKDYHIK